MSGESDILPGPSSPVERPPEPGRPRKRTRRLLAVGALLLLLGAGAWPLGRLLWARHHQQQAREALEARDFPRALRHAQRCLEIRPRDPDAHLLAAQAARRAGRLDEARRHLRACAELSPALDGLRLERRLLQATRGDLAGVEADLLDRVRRDAPEAPLVLEALAAGHVLTRHVPQAHFCTDELLRRQPDHAQALVWRGWVMERQRRFPEARDDYRRAVALRPEDVWARLSLAEVLLHLNQPAEAEEQFAQLRDRLPDNAAILLGLARCWRELGRTEEARRVLDGLLASHPDEFLVLAEQGHLLLQERHAEEAERYLRRALAAAPSDRRINQALFECLEQQGKEMAAREQFARVQRIDADLKRLSQLTRAIATTVRAPARRCEVGVLCLRLGDEEEGVGWLQSALQEDPSLAAAHRALADYYERKGRSALAARHRRAAGRK